jgi:hypothetical protein
MNMRLLHSLFALALCAAALRAADAPTAAKVFESQLGGMEREFVPLVEAMPADKFNFAPTAGAFKGVRTFGAQAKHVSFVLYQISSAILGEKNPSAGGPDENGPASLQSKEEIVKYVKDAFAYAHKAVATLTSENLLGETTDPFNPKGRRARLDSAAILISHSFDHYGQMVEYARMNNVIPPASR